MKRFRPYVWYGVAVLGLLAASELRGWSMLRPTEVKNVPRTVRENPGVYRSHYAGSARYPRGK